MKVYPVLLSLLLLAACSTTYEVETSKIGVERVELDQESYERPQLYVGKFDFKKEAKREPASIQTLDQGESLSNRQLYFLTYYNQYLSLGKVLGKKNEINVCPSFHDVLLTHEKNISPISKNMTSIKNISKVKEHKDMVVNYPVLAIPYSSKQDLFSKLENQKWDEADQTVVQALEHYYEIEKQEVQTLCDRGVSPGYYIFENLVTYFKNDSSFHRTQVGLKALLKVPVISNMVILDSLIDHNAVIGNKTALDNTLMLRSNLGWFSEYRAYLKSNRNQKFTAKAGSFKK